MDTPASLDTPVTKHSREDIVARQKQLRREAQERLARLSTTTNKPVAVPSPSSSIVRKEGERSIFLPVLISVSALALSGYAFWKLNQVEQQLAASNVVVQEQQRLVAELNERLTPQDEDSNDISLSEKLASQQAQLKSLSTELPQRLKDISDQLTAVQATQGELTLVASNQRKSIKAFEQDLEKLGSRIQLSSTTQPSQPAQVASTELVSIKRDIEALKKSAGYRDITEVKLDMEDLKIRLDRMQNLLAVER